MFRFLRDYDELFPVEDDVSLLQQASSTLYPLLSPCFANLDTLLDSSMAVAFLLLLPLVKLNDQQQRIEKPSLKKTKPLHQSDTSAKLIYTSLRWSHQIRNFSALMKSI